MVHTPAPTPQPTPWQTAPPTPWPTMAPSPIPTPWWEHPVAVAEMTDQEKVMIPIMAKLEEMIDHVTKLLKTGGDGDKVMWCEDFEKQVKTVQQTYEHANEEPHKWALGEVVNEMTWLCTDDHGKKAQLPEHAQMLREVVDMYHERLQCMPGDAFSTEHGVLSGLKPDCVCTCNIGWVGEGCHEQAAG